MSVLLVIPPLTQLNTPYPSTAFLAHFLRAGGVKVAQADASLELALRLFSKRGLRLIQKHLSRRPALRASSAGIRNFLRNVERYVDTVDLVVSFLQGRNVERVGQIARRSLLPEGPRFRALDQLVWDVDDSTMLEQAKYVASLYMDDLADVVREGVDARFELSRYAEKISVNLPSFEPLRRALEGRGTLIDRMIDRIAAELIDRDKPRLVGLTVPFPGNVYGAFRIARAIKRLSPKTRIVIGGGYVNTELRELSDPRVFDYVDYVMLDDGEVPLMCLVEHLKRRRPASRLKRTFVRRGGRVLFVDGAVEPDASQKDCGTPDYVGLPLDRYISVCELPNPMHRLWSDGRWNKLQLAHGCYWRKCSFCDTSLDYIGRHQPGSPDLIVERMGRLIKETGVNTFHFVDEAAPPSLLRAVADRLIAEGIQAEWWCNIRFESAFTPRLAGRMAEAGCIAVAGGLETVCNRTLKLMNKGIAVESAARAMHALSETGIMIHAYLMYGFPTQTRQEIIDALERVRQLFNAGCLHSAYWHRFALTCHSPVASDPERFGIRLLPQAGGGFARNEVRFARDDKADSEMARGLNTALYNYLHGAGLHLDLADWFHCKIPATSVRPDEIAQAIHGRVAALRS